MYNFEELICDTYQASMGILASNLINSYVPDTLHIWYDDELDAYNGLSLKLAFKDKLITVALETVKEEDSDDYYFLVNASDEEEQKRDKFLFPFLKDYLKNNPALSGYADYPDEKYRQYYGVDSNFYVFKKINTLQIPLCFFAVILAIQEYINYHML